MNFIRRSKPPVLLQADESAWPVRSSGSRRRFARSRVLRTTGSAARRSGPAPRRRRRGSSARPSSRRRTGPASRVASVSDGAALPSSRRRPGGPRRRSRRGRASSAATRAGSGGSFCSLRFQLGAALGGGRGGRAGVGEEAGDVGRARGRAARGSRRSRSASWASCSRWAARIAEHPVGLAQDRVGPLDDLLEVVAAAGEAGAEFVEDQAEALRVGQRAGCC